MPTAKRILSFIMAVTMIAGIMSFGVSAEEVAYPEVTYWNANSTAIIIDITEDIDADTLAGAITLTKNGEDIPFVLEKKIPTTTETLDDAEVRSTSYATANYREALEADGDYTYEIHPECGIDFDEMYILTIGGDVLGTEWKKGITVRKLWKETFDNYESADLAPWASAHGGLTLEGDTDKYLKYAPAVYRSALSPAYKYASSSWVETKQDDTSEAKRNAEFADTGKVSKSFWASAVKEKEYNLEMELRVEPYNKGDKIHGIQIYFGDRTNYGPGWSGSFVMAGTGFSPDRHLDKDNAIIAGTETSIRYRMYSGTVNMFASTRGSSSYGYQVNGPVALPNSGIAVPGRDTNLFLNMGGAVYTDDAAESVLATSVLSDSDNSNDVTNRISMSVKNHNIKFGISSLDKSGFTSYNYTQGISDSNVNIGLPIFVFETSGYNASTYCIDNIVATKAEGISVKGVTVTPQSGSVDVATDNPVNIDFGAPVDEATVSNETVIVYRNGEIDNGYQATVNRKNPNIVDIVFADGMKNSAEYSVVIEGVYYAGDSTEYRFDPSQYYFTTIAPEVELTGFSTSKNVDMAEMKAGTYDVSATVVNNRKAEGAEGVLTICLYDEYMTMIDFKVKRINIPLGESDTISDTWEITEPGKYTASCYLWDSFGGMDVSLIGALE